MKHMQGEKIQRFSIRKLSIGAASVMIGAVLWLGAPNTTVHADKTNDPNNTELTKVAQSETQAHPIAQKSDIKKASKSDLTPPKVKTTSNQQQVNENSEQTIKLRDLNRDSTSSIGLNDNKIEQQSVDKNGDNTLTVDHKVFDPTKKENVTITLKLGGTANVDAPKPDDTYTITIPGGAYSISEENGLNQPEGHSERTENPDGSVTYKETFNQSEAHTFNYVLSPLTIDNLADNSLPKITYGNTTKIVKVTKSTKENPVAQDFLQVQFKQHLAAKLTPSFNRVTPNSDQSTKLGVKQDYTYEVSVEQADGILSGAFRGFDPLVTNSGTITITVPQKFKLNKAVTDRQNVNRGVKITQTGDKIAITYNNSQKNISRDQLKKHKQVDTI